MAKSQPYVPGDDGLGDSLSRGLGSGPHLDGTAHANRDSDLLARVAARWPLSLAVAGAAVVVAMLGSSQLLSNASTADVPALAASNEAATDALVGSGAGENEWRETLRNLIEPSLPRIEVVTGDITRSGRGIVLGDDGHIMTSAQLTDQADMILVHTSGGQRFTALLSGSDPLTDVAVIHVADDAFTDPAAPLGTDVMVRAGHPALTLSASDHTSLSVGQINHVGAKRMMGNGQGSYGMIGFAGAPAAVDVAAEPGSAIFDEQGRTIGMVPLLADVGVDHATAAVPIKMAHRIASELVLGNFERPWLGVKVREAAEPGSVPGSVVEVVEIFESGPARNANLVVGDRITAFNGVEITSTSDLLMGVWDQAANAEVEIGVLRDFEHFFEPITLAPRPDTSVEGDS